MSAVLSAAGFEVEKSAETVFVSKLVVCRKPTQQPVVEEETPIEAEEGPASDN